jgi:hypothetical protein
VTVAHSLSGPRPEGNSKVALAVPGSLPSGGAKASSPLKSEDFPAFPIVALPTLPEGRDQDAERGSPPFDSNASVADAPYSRPEKSAA